MTICDNLALLNLEEISIHNYITFLVRIDKATLLVFKMIDKSDYRSNF